MKLATLNDGTRDGALIVVTKDGTRFSPAAGIAHTLQQALDDWDHRAPLLRQISRELESGEAPGTELDPTRLMAPLPRAYEWLDGSAFLNHVELVRRARGAEIPDFLEREPLMYQGGSGVLLGPHQELELPNPEWGLDYEAEVCAIVGDVPRGTGAREAGAHIRLFTLANDVSYRNLIPSELRKGFGFVISKPATAFAPFAITPDELGPHLISGRVHLPLRSFVNDELMGSPHAGSEMHFSFSDLIAHVCQTRALTAGTIIGSGTVSNRDPARGVSCLAERRVREILEAGEATTPFLGYGDRVRIEMRSDDDSNLFGTIDQRVVKP